jgi:hypothetical protein
MGIEDEAKKEFDEIKEELETELEELKGELEDALDDAESFAKKFRYYIFGGLFVLGLVVGLIL